MDKTNNCEHITLEEVDKLLKHKNAVILFMSSKAIYVYEDEKAFMACKLLLERGVYVNPVISPATPKGMALLRTSYTATHTKAQMDKAMKAIKEVLDILEVK